MRTGARSNHRHRGVAMLLVLISLGMAVILTTAYVTSRDNSAAIGENIASACAARSTAMAGLDLSVSILETEADWRTGHTAGILLENYDLDGIPIDVELIDVITGDPPDESTTYVRVIVTASAAGVEQAVAATAYVPLSPGGSGGAVDVDLSEFAIFSGEYIQLNGESTVTRWPNAPLSVNGDRIAFGTRADSMQAVEVSSTAAAIDTDIYHGPDASGSLLSNLTNLALNLLELEDNVPLPDPPSVGVTVPPDPGNSEYSFKWLTGVNELISSDDRWSFAQLASGAQMRLQGDITVVSETSMILKTDARLIIDGNVRLIIFQALAIDDAGIELEDGATLELFVGDTLYVKDGYIGDFRDDPDLRDSSGGAGWMDPERIQIFGTKMSETIFGYEDSDRWELTANSVVKASVYTPLRRVEIKDSSALYGRLAALSISLNNDGAIFYDHGLDDGFGFTNPSSPMFADGRIKGAFLSMPSFDLSSLQSASDLTGLPIKSAGKTVGAAVNSDPPPPDPGDPTPRPVEVSYDVTAVGADVTSWESGL